MSADAETRAQQGTGAAKGSDGIPERLGKYVIEKMLGKGGMGAVYLARDSELRRTVALKVLPKDKAENPTLVRRFKAEAQAAAQLRHDNIVAVYDSDEADGYLFIAMEYVEGRDLFDMISHRGTIPVKRSLEIIKQVAQALEHAHQLKIVHRDIKPSNLLIRRDGMVKLTDLGLARSIDDTIETGITRAGTTVGTVDYMAPEQARSSKAADIRSDIYSLGCTWYQMLTGHPPFPEGSMTNKLQAHAIKPIPDPRTENPNVTEGLVAVIQRMMAKKPEDRYQTPGELLKDLEYSTLTRAAFSQEILAALDEDDAVQTERGGKSTADESAPRQRQRPARAATSESQDSPASERAEEVAEKSRDSGSGRRKGTSLPPPSRRKAVEEQAEEPTRDWGESIKVAAVILGAIAGVAGLAWLAVGLGGSLGQWGSSPVVKPVGQEVPVPGEVGVAAVGATAVAEGQAISGGTAVAPTYGTGTATIPGSSTASAVPGASGSGAPPTYAISTAMIHQVRPTDPRQRPKFVKTTGKPAVSLTVGPGSPSAQHLRSLNDALLKLPPEGGVIRLIGSGPFPLTLNSTTTVRQLTLLGDPQSSSIVVLGSSADGTLGRLSVQGDLTLENVHFVADATASAALALVDVLDGNLQVSRCSLSVLGESTGPVVGIRLQSNKSAQRLIFQRSVIRGTCQAGIELKSSSVDAAIEDSLVALQSGSVIQFAGRPGLTPADVTSRWLRVFASTLSTTGRLIDFSPEQGISEPPRTELYFDKVVGCVPSDGKNAVLLSVTDWLQTTVRDRISWTATASTFLGFRRLVDLGERSSFRADDADGWRQFWRQRPEPQEFVVGNWPEHRMSAELADSAGFSRDLLPAEVRQGRSGDDLPGISIDWLTLPGNVNAGRLSALASRPAAPDEPAWASAPRETIKVDLKKQDLGQLLAKENWPDGAVIEAAGFGVCPISPVVIQGKQLKIVFRQTEGSPLRVVPREGARPTMALFELNGGSLILEGLRLDFPEIRPRHPAWFVVAKEGHVRLNRCDIRGPSAAVEQFAGLVRWTVGMDMTAPPTSLVLEDSILLGAGMLLDVTGGNGRVFVRNCALASDAPVLRVQLLADAGGRIPLVVDVTSSSVSSARSALTVQAASLPEAATKPARFYVDDLAVLPPAPWKAVKDTSKPAFVALTGPVLEQKQVAWWGSRNGVARAVGVLLEGNDPALKLPVTNPADWDAAWGPGHDLNLLTGADGVVPAGPWPAKTDQITVDKFGLHSACKGMVWSDGRPIGVDLGQLEQAGNPPVVAPNDAKPSTPSTPKAGGTTPRRPGF